MIRSLLHYVSLALVDIFQPDLTLFHFKKMLTKFSHHSLKHVDDMWADEIDMKFITALDTQICVGSCIQATLVSQLSATS